MRKGSRFLSVLLGLCLAYWVLTYSVALLPSFPSPFRHIVAPSSYHRNAGVLKYVNPKIGTYGLTPNGNGGMIPSVSLPFGMTRWTSQTRENFISQCPYNDIDEYIHGFQATHQPAIWMGESGNVVLDAGIGDVKPLFVDRAKPFRKEDEISTPYVYEVLLDAESVSADHHLTESIYSPVPGGAQPVPELVSEGANGRVRRTAGTESQRSLRSKSLGPYERSIKVAMTATAHVGFLRLDFDNLQGLKRAPYVFVQATRQNGTGTIKVNPHTREVYGSNNLRQDYALGPNRATSFSGYFVSRFSEPFLSYGIAHEDRLSGQSTYSSGETLGAYVTFKQSTHRVEVRTGISFVSIEQARANLAFEIPDSVTFEQAVDRSKTAWLEKLGRVEIQGTNETDAEHDPKTIWYTSLFHALQYPSDFSEPLDSASGVRRTFYSGYKDDVMTAEDSYYQSWSIWDTFRAEHSLLTIFAPERVNSMMRSLVQIYEWAGRLPMWANVIETNIMIGTHVDAIFANALTRGFKDFDIQTAWHGVEKNCFEPPINDTTLLYYDREGYTPDEARAGLTSYMSKGFVANDGWSESASRTLDYAFDDHAAAIVAEFAGNQTAADVLHARSQNYRKIYNSKTGFMEAKNANGTWAGSEHGWTEGDDWIYTFNVMHDPMGLADLMGGPSALKRKLDTYFSDGHNDHSNEPSHHAPYMYAAVGFPSDTQRIVREIAFSNYNATPAGLSGNEDLGQMSAWYIFTALGFYPLDPASDEYVVGSPFFEKVTIRLPAGAATGGVGGQEHTLTISAPHAPTRSYVKSLKVDGKAALRPFLTHRQIVNAKLIEFEMASEPQSWGART